MANTVVEYAIVALGLLVLYLALTNLATIVAYWYVVLVFILFFLGVWEYNKSGRVENVVKGVVLFLATCLLCCLLLEVALRITGFDETNWFGNGKATGDFYESVQVNELGFRGPLIDSYASSTKVALLGDSFLFGSAVLDDSSIFSSLLQEKVGNSYQMMNLGVPGYNTFAQISVFSEMNRRYGFEKILLFYFINDAEEAAINDYSQQFYTYLLPGSIGRYLYDVSLAYYFLESRTDRVLEKIGVQPSYDDYLHYIYTTDYLQEHRQLLTQFMDYFGDDLVVVIIPVLHDLNNYQYQYAHDYVNDIASTSGTTVIDLKNAFVDMDESALVVGPYDYHFNEKAHGIVADYLYAELVDIGFFYHSLISWCTFLVLSG